MSHAGPGSEGEGHCRGKAVCNGVMDAQGTVSCAPGRSRLKVSLGRCEPAGSPSPTGALLGQVISRVAPFFLPHKQEYTAVRPE